MKGEALANEQGTHTFSAGEGVPAPQLVSPSQATGRGRLHRGQFQALPLHPAGRNPRRPRPAVAHSLVRQCGLRLVLAGALAEGERGQQAIYAGRHVNWCPVFLTWAR